MVGGEDRSGSGRQRPELRFSCGFIQKLGIDMLSKYSVHGNAVTN